VQSFKERDVHLFVRIQDQVFDATMKRAWDRVMDYAITVLPRRQGEDLYFVNIEEARPKLSKDESGMSSFNRAMRRAGLMSPKKTLKSKNVSVLWAEYVNYIVTTLRSVTVDTQPVPASLPTTDLLEVVNFKLEDEAVKVLETSSSDAENNGSASSPSDGIEEMIQSSEDEMCDALFTALEHLPEDVFVDVFTDNTIADI